MKTLLVLILSILFSAPLAAGDDFPYSVKKHEKKMIERNLKLAEKQYKYEQNSLFDFYVDLQLGYGLTNADIKSNNGAGEYDTESKGGFNAGALFFLNLLDILKFSSGIDFLQKKFEVNPPTVINFNQGIDTNTTDVTAQTLNIPLNFNFGGMLSEKFGLTFNGGPYLGVILSADEDAGLGYKNFDLGLNGTITANYVIAPLTSIILGTKLHYGGLNNLGRTDNVESMRTMTYGFFSGVRFAL